MSEIVGLAFFSLGKTQPDFEAWIKETDVYKNAKPSEKVNILRRDRERLQSGLTKYTAADNPIRIQTYAYITPPSPEERAQLAAEKKSFPMKVELEAGMEEHFPFYIGGLWVAVVPNGIHDKLHVTMDEGTYRIFANRLPPDGKGRHKGVLKLILNPTAAETRMPVTLSGIDAWLLMTDVKSVELWDAPRGDSFWFYRAEGFIQPEEKTLLDLHKTGP